MLFDVRVSSPDKGAVQSHLCWRKSPAAASGVVAVIWGPTLGGVLKGLGAVAGGGTVGELAIGRVLLRGVPGGLQHLPVLLEGLLCRGVGIARYRTDHCPLHL